MITEVWFWAILSFLMFAGAYQIVVWWKDKWSKFSFVFEEYSIRLSFLERCQKYFQFFHKPLMATAVFCLFSFVTVAGYHSSINQFRGEAAEPHFESHASSEASSMKREKPMAEPAAYEYPKQVASEKVECTHPPDDVECDSHDLEIEAAKHFEPVDIYIQPAVRAPAESSGAEAAE